MAENPTHTRAVCLVLHDVAPSTWPAYEAFVAKIDARGGIPLTLLVVPNFHRRDSIEKSTSFLDAMQRRLALGDELVLHGFYHDDPGPIPLRPREWFMRRVYTHEAEFYRLDEATALQRLESGLAMFGRLDWPVTGFVPPAWLLGEGGRRALSRLPLRYTSDPGGLIRLPDFQRVAAPSLVWSARSAWRRWLSRRWNDRLLQRHHAEPLLRLGLHPVDMQHSQVQRYWLDTLTSLREQRTPLTKSAWLDQIT